MTKIVGVLGGMGPLATHAFYGALTAATEAGRDQDHLHVIIDSDTTIPDRTEFLIGSGPDPRPALLRAVRRLEDAGCDLLVMPCNTAHAFADYITERTSLEFVNWIEKTADVLSGATSVGVMATLGTLRADLYQAALRKRGARAIIPDDHAQTQLMHAIYGAEGVKGGHAAQAARQGVLAVADRLADAGAEVIVLGCTELPLVVDATAPDWPVPVIDPAVVVAREVVRLAGATLSPTPSTLARRTGWKTS